MEHLWAPWRNAYVKKHDMTDTSKLFETIAQSNNDEEHFVILRSKACYAILNRYPYNLGHLMVIPYRAVPDLADLSQDELSDLWNTINRCTSLLRKTIQPKGFNVGINIGAAAGAGIPHHLHVHIVPRWEGDTNFMTTVEHTRIHPGDLEGVYKTLCKALHTE